MVSDDQADGLHASTEKWGEGGEWPPRVLEATKKIEDGTSPQQGQVSARIVSSKFKPRGLVSRENPMNDIIGRWWDIFLVATYRLRTPTTY